MLHFIFDFAYSEEVPQETIEKIERIEARAQIVSDIHPNLALYPSPIVVARKVVGQQFIEDVEIVEVD